MFTDSFTIVKFELVFVILLLLFLLFILLIHVICDIELLLLLKIVNFLTRATMIHTHGHMPAKRQYLNVKSF